MTRWIVALVLALGTGGAIAACGTDSASQFDDGTGLDSGSSGTSGSSGFLPGDGGGEASVGAFEISPPNPVLTATGAPVNQQFHAYLKGTTTEVPVSWSLDVGTLGNIGTSTGLFTANGVVGGVANVIATAGASQATTTVTVNVSLVDANGLSPADQALLAAGGPLSGDPAMKWLYPYDKTVFPRGLRSPLLQFAGAAPDQTLVRFKSLHFQYDAFFGASNPGRVQLAEARWKTITQSASGTDTVAVSITKKSGGVVVGPIAETWTIATASLSGTVYYNTYNTPQAGNSGALLKVRPSTTIDATVLEAGCSVCHSVSANGTVIATGISWGGGDPLNSGVFNVDATGAATAGHSQAKGAYAFAALTPDAKYMMTHSNNAGGIRGLTNASGQYSTLLDPTTGVAVPGVTGWAATAQAQMPSFSPDGKFIAFNDRVADASGKTLGVMAFDQKTLKFTTLGSVWTGSSLVAWPAFLPDSTSIVFHAGDDFGTQKAHHADIELVDVASKKRMYVPALNGYAGTDTVNGATYLPYGDAAEGHLNFEPTVLPVASGGYFWVVFTSRRCYGNLLPDTQDAWGKDGSNPDELSPRKKLWVAAIDITGTPGKDRSHPAFYLPGQELGTGNMRAFWALDPCHANGQSCETGDECCGGYCRQVAEADGATGFTCSDKPAGCAQELEKCTTAADCCGAASGVQCINGHCASAGPK
jgi:hypothetical protein